MSSLLNGDDITVMDRMVAHAKLDTGVGGLWEVDSGKKMSLLSSAN